MSSGDTWWNWYYFDRGQVDNAKEQIEFLKERIANINKKCNMSRIEKLDKITKINISINALKYTYSL